MNLTNKKLFLPSSFGEVGELGPEMFPSIFHFSLCQKHILVSGLKLAVYAYMECPGDFRNSRWRPVEVKVTCQEILLHPHRNGQSMVLFYI